VKTYRPRPLISRRLICLEIVALSNPGGPAPDPELPSENSGIIIEIVVFGDKNSSDTSGTFGRYPGVEKSGVSIFVVFPTIISEGTKFSPFEISDFFQI